MIRKKQVLSARELETEKILQEQLPEYTIRANMRLADVIHAGRQFKYMQGYHLDFVICDEKANTIAAVELDDSTHDTKDGEWKDNNKNRWMAEAGIKLIRIREPSEAKNIRTLIEQQEIPDPKQFWISREAEEPAKIFNYPPIRVAKKKDINIQGIGKYLLHMAGVIIFALIAFGTVNAVIQNNLKRATSNISAQQQKIPAPQSTSVNWQKQHEAEQAETRRRIDAREPRYERVFVKGKSARECKNEKGVMDNNTVKCMNDHYEMVQISGNQ